MCCLESDIIMRDIHKYIRDLMAGPLLSDWKNAFEGAPYCVPLYNPDRPFDGRRRRPSEKPRQSQDPFLALTSWFYSFHELALYNPFASGSFFARNLRCADRFRVYVNPLEITSSKKRRTVIPLPQEESATALKRATFMREFSSCCHDDFSATFRHIELRREKSGSGFVHRRTVIYLRFAVLSSAG